MRNARGGRKKGGRKTKGMCASAERVLCFFRKVQQSATKLHGQYINIGPKNEFVLFREVFPHEMRRSKIPATRQRIHSSVYRVRKFSGSLIGASSQNDTLLRSFRGGKQ